MSVDFSQISGHKRHISALERFVQRGLQSGTFLFVGPEHCGKAALAKTFAAMLLGISCDDLSRHPDVLLVSPDVDEDTHRKIYAIETVRDVIHRLSQSSISGRAIAIIDDANVLNIPSQNALLKTLEEPSASTIVILISHDPVALLPTIRSRAMVFDFFSLEEMQRTEDEWEKSLIDQFLSGSLCDRLRAAQIVAKNESKAWESFFFIVLELLRQKTSSPLPTAHALDAVLTARERLAGNGNSTVVLTELAVQLSQ